MRRRPFPFCSAVSLLLFAAGSALWVRGYWASDVVGWGLLRGDGRGTVYLVATAGRGGLGAAALTVGESTDTGPHWVRQHPA